MHSVCRERKSSNPQPPYKTPARLGTFATSADQISRASASWSLPLDNLGSLKTSPILDATITVVGSRLICLALETTAASHDPAFALHSSLSSLGAVESLATNPLLAERGLTSAFSSTHRQTSFNFPRQVLVDRTSRTVFFSSSFFPFFDTLIVAELPLPSHFTPFSKPDTFYRPSKHARLFIRAPIGPPKRRPEKYVPHHLFLTCWTNHSSVLDYVFVDEHNRHKRLKGMKSVHHKPTNTDKSFSDASL